MKLLNLLLVCLLLITTACNNDDDDVSISEENLVGEWTLTECRLTKNYTNEDYPDTVFPFIINLQSCDALFTINADKTYLITNSVDCLAEYTETFYSGGTETSMGRFIGNETGLWTLIDGELQFLYEGQTGPEYTHTYKITKVTDTVIEAEIVIDLDDLSSGISVDVVENFLKFTRQ